MRLPDCIYALVLALAPVQAWQNSPATSFVLSNHGRKAAPFQRFATQNHRCQTTTTTSKSSTVLSMNLFSDIGDMVTGGKLVAQQSLPYGDSLAAAAAVAAAAADDNDNQRVRTFAVQERLVTFTGEDFDVMDLDNQSDFVRVRGAMLHLPGKDKMRIQDSSSNQVLAVMDRKLLAMKPTYDVYNGKREKIGWLEKASLSLTDTFDFYAECEKGGVGPFAAPPAYKLEGDFLDRRFVMKNAKGEVVAKVTMDRLIEFDEYDHYQVRVAPGMDPVLVIACACAIDEEFDEEHKKEREKREA